MRNKDDMGIVIISIRLIFKGFFDFTQNLSYTAGNSNKESFL